MLKEFLRDLARWADDPITQGVVIGVGTWLVLELLLAHQAKITAQTRHLRMHGERIGDAERGLATLERGLHDLNRRVVSRETSPPGVMFGTSDGPNIRA